MTFMYHVNFQESVRAPTAHLLALITRRRISADVSSFSHRLQRISIRPGIHFVPSQTHGIRKREREREQAEAIQQITDLFFHFYL